jgi:hypothetical protein
MESRSPKGLLELLAWSVGVEHSFFAEGDSRNTYPVVYIGDSGAVVHHTSPSSLGTSSNLPWIEVHAAFPL